VDACPPQAFTGKPFRVEEAREVRFDVHACSRYQGEIKEKMGSTVCGMCLYSCPHGQL